MNWHHRIFAVLVAMCALVGGTPAVAGQGDLTPPFSSVGASETSVDIPDEALRATIERALGKEPGDPITRDEMATLRSLSVNPVRLASGDGLVRRLNGIEHALNLEHFGSAQGAFSDLTPLGALVSLVRLSLTASHVDITDITPLANLDSLEELALHVNANVVDLRVLADLASLKKLHLSESQMVDVGPLAGLTTLESLVLSDNRIVDVGPLAGLTTLASLNLSGNRIVDVGPLADLATLESLVLSGNRIVDVGPLAGLTTLASLDLSRNEGVDIGPIADLTSLERLVATGSGIVDLSPLEGLTSIVHLDLTDNDISDLAPLVANTGFGSNRDAGGWRASVNLRTNPLSTVSIESHIPALLRKGVHVWADAWDQLLDIPDPALRKALRESVATPGGTARVSRMSLWRVADDIDGENVNDLTGIEHAVNAESIRLVNGSITNLEPLSNLTSLEYLTLSGNEVVDLGPLANLTSLKSLVLSDNEIVELGPLASLRSLEWLELAGNKVTGDPWPLAKLTSLGYLDLSDNEIVGVSSLEFLNLGFLELSNNAIMDVVPLVRQLRFRSLDIDLTGNPLGAASVGLLLRHRIWAFDQPALEDAALTDAIERSIAIQGRLRFGDPRNQLSFDRTVRVSNVPFLDASNSGIQRLDGLEHAQGLEGLFLDGNEITDISPLGAFTTTTADFSSASHRSGRVFLITLSLADNKIEDWTPLAGMHTLRHLALDRNSLDHLPALPRYLYGLYLTDNFISDISSLAAQPELAELQLSGNRVASLEALSEVELRYLHVEDNEVADLSPLNFGELRELLARNNKVRDLSPLLDGEQLLIVDVRRNPLADESLDILDTLRERRVTVLAGETVPYFPSAGARREGYVRIVNRSEQDGHVFIGAVDDGGVRRGPVRLEVGAGRAVHFDSADLEDGNRAKGLRTGIGQPTEGDWRLSVTSALDVEVLSYVRTRDGLVTPMHDVVPDEVAPLFSAGDSRATSILRVVNTEAEPAKWTTGGYDDGGEWHPMTGSTLVRPEHSLTLTAEALEDTHGLGDGDGRWWLRVRGYPWFTMSLLESPTGHLTNLSTAPDNATPLADGRTMYRVPLFPAAGGSLEGLARVINRSYASGEVAIVAVDDEGNRSRRVRLTLDPRQAVHFNSRDLERGNAAKGLVGGAGAGKGDWRLEVTSDLDLMVLSYVQSADDFLASLHDLAPVAADGSHRVVFFNPGSSTRQVSKLRLINDGERAASVAITGIDDRGSRSGIVTLSVPANSALTLTSAELEAGEDGRLAGSLGNGSGRWRLRVRSDEPIAVMSLLEAGGYLTNVSTGTAAPWAPLATAPVPDQFLAVDGNATLDLSSYFSGDRTLAFDVASGNTDVVRVSVTGNVLTLVPVAGGWATVTVTAQEGEGHVRQTLQVVVGSAVLSDRSIALGWDAVVDLSRRFLDDEITFEAESGDADVVRASVAANMLTLAPVAEGRATVTVTARDADGDMVRQTFEVVVTPETTAPLPDQRLFTGGNATLDLSLHISDDRTFAFAVATSDADVVRVTVKGNVLTLAPVAEGRAMVTVTARDADGNVVRQTFQVVVSAVLPDRPLAIDWNATLDLSLYFSNEETGFEAESSDADVVRVSVTGELLTLTLVAEGRATVTVTARDADGNVVRQMFQVVVTEDGQLGKQPPQATAPLPNQALAIGEDAMLDLSLHFSDDQTLVFEVDSSDGDVVRVSVSGNVLTLAPVADGNATVTVTARDADGYVVQQTFRAIVSEEGQAGAGFQDCPECPEMVVVPAGSFMMGSPPGEEAHGRRSNRHNERPQHRVEFAAPFAIGAFEVTFKQWDACVADGGCSEPEDYARLHQPNHPVRNVSWNDAQAYVEWLSAKTGQAYRLPSDAEWEYAARAGTTTPFHFGEEITTDQANYDGRVRPREGSPPPSSYVLANPGIYRGEPVPVGSLPANPWGLHEVHGNVWEWTRDCDPESGTGYELGWPADGSAVESGNCRERFYRGGSFYDDPVAVRSAVRWRSYADDEFDGRGFRVAKTLGD